MGIMLNEALCTDRTADAEVHLPDALTILLSIISQYHLPRLSYVFVDCKYIDFSYVARSVIMCIARGLIIPPLHLPLERADITGMAKK